MAILVIGCGSAEPPAAAEAGAESPPVAVIGWDGATWEVIEPMLEAGRLPHLAALIEGGTRARLLAEPPLLSPVAWTTLATGFPHGEHGISGFNMPDPTGNGSPILAASFHRKRAALWQMVSAAPGREVGFIGWWTTWPAEPVRGYVVTDHLAFNRWDAWARRPNNDAFHLTYPAELTDELSGVAVRPEQTGAETLTALVAFNERERQEMMAASRPVIFHGPSVFRYGYSTDASNLAFARHLLDTREQPDLFAVSFILTDVAGHVFWHHYRPESYANPPADAGRLADAIPDIYEQVDRWTGELLARLEPDTRVLLISDHGMRSTGQRPVPGRNPAGDHDPAGIFVASGPGLRRGAELHSLSSLDFTPTVLALLGLPVADDMPGRVVHELFDGPALWNGARVPSYGDGRDGKVEMVESPADEAYRDRLKALGYIGE